MSIRKPEKDNLIMEDWKKLALAAERDPHLRKILIEGPKGLSASWYYQAMHRKYGRSKD